MKDLGLEYGFVRYAKHPIVYPYWVGEYQESAPSFESGHSISTFLLTGFHRGEWADLETQKEQIENYFNIEGKTYQIVLAYYDANGKLISTNIFDKKMRF